MTEMQRQFYEAWFDGARYNATEAARMAGYRWPNKVAYRLMQDPKVGALIHAEFLRRHPGVARMEAEWEERKRREALRQAARDRRNARRRARRAEAKAAGDESLPQA